MNNDDYIRFRDQKIEINGQTVNLKWNKSIEQSINNKFLQAQQFVDNEVIRLSIPLTPMKTGTLAKSPYASTRLGTGVVRYGVPYDRYQYYRGKTNGNRGPLWFERMKTANGKQILENARRIMK